MSKRRKVSRPPVPSEEKARLRAMKLVGNDFAIGIDGYGRERMVPTAISGRNYDIGTMKAVVRVRNVDPLAGMSSLSFQQRKAGARYREEYETCAMEGVKTGSWDIRVDGGGGDRDRPQRIADAHRSLADADTALGYREIRRIVVAVCGRGLSVKALAEQEGNPRDVVAHLLGMGLDRLALHYGIVTPPKRS